MKENLLNKLDDVKDEETFIAYLKDLSRDYNKHTEEWHNHDIKHFLDCAAAWAEDSLEEEKYFQKQENLWRRCAEILYCGRLHE